ncbi:hypothetical protein B0H17DRAFT_961532, partial [Mycena rosella]
RIRKSVRYMSQSRTIIYKKVFLSIWNHLRIRSLNWIYFGTLLKSEWWKRTDFKRDNALDICHLESNQSKAAQRTIPA